MTASIHTDLGVFTARFTAHGLCGLDFPGRATSESPHGNPLPAPQKRWARQLAFELNCYFRGGLRRFNVPLDLRRGTVFQRRVWSEMEKIPAGQTRSYAEIAAAIGKPRAARAVGNACGANPVPIVVPCHRVIAKDGALGGFSGGLGWKRRLLRLEAR